MKSVYGKGKVCPMEKKDCNLESEGLGLEPGLEEIIGSPMKHSYEELAYAWEGWRNATGRVMINDFKEYVDISNEVAKANGKYRIFTIVLIELDMQSDFHYQIT